MIVEKINSLNNINNNYRLNNISVCAKPISQKGTLSDFPFYGIYTNKLINNINARAVSKQLEPGYLVNLYKTKILDKNDITKIFIESAGQISKEDICFFTQKKVRITEFDNNQILSTRLAVMKAPDMRITDNEYLAAEKGIIKNEFQKIDQIPSQGKMIIVSGLSGSGKSTYINNGVLGNKQDFYLADIDIIKKYFDNYDEGKKLNIYHNVSRHILQNMLIPEAIRLKKNIIIPTTGLNEYFIRLAEPAKARKYNVELQVLLIDKIEAMKRAIDRFEETGRFIDPYFIATRNFPVNNQYFELKDCQSIDRIKTINCNKVNFKNCSLEDINNNTFIFK